MEKEGTLIYLFIKSLIIKNRKELFSLIDDDETKEQKELNIDNEAKWNLVCNFDVNEIYF